MPESPVTPESAPPIDARNIKTERIDLGERIDHSAPTIATTSAMQPRRAPTFRFWLLIFGVLISLLIITAVSAFFVVKVWDKAGTDLGNKQNAAGTGRETNGRLTFSFNIRKLSNGIHLAPYKAPRGETFSIGDKFTMNLKPADDGHLFVLNEGLDETSEHIFNLIFPTPSVNGGSPSMSGGETIETALNTVTAQPGRELIWIIWTKEPKPELEEIRRLAFANRGAVRDQVRSEWLKNFLAENSQTSAVRTETTPNKETVIKASGDTVVYMAELWPPLGHSP